MKENNSTTNIYFHPVIVSILLLGPILMSLVIWQLLVGEKAVSILIFTVFYIIITVLLTIKIIKLFRHMISGKPALILTKNHLVDNYSELTIDWNDISEIEIRSSKVNYVSIKLYDREKYISKLNNPVNRLMYRVNSKLFHGTFTIMVGLMKGRDRDILETLENYQMRGKEPAHNSGLTLLRL